MSASDDFVGGNAGGDPSPADPYDALHRLWAWMDDLRARRAARDALPEERRFYKRLSPYDPGIRLCVAAELDDVDLDVLLEALEAAERALLDLLNRGDRP